MRRLPALAALLLAASAAATTIVADRPVVGLGQRVAAPARARPPVAVFKASFAATGAALPDDANTLTNLTWTGTALQDSRSAPWSMTGTVPQVSGANVTPLYPAGFGSNSRQAAGTFADSNYYSLGSPTLNVADDFMVEAAFIPVTNAINQGFLGNYLSTSGWGLDLRVSDLTINWTLCGSGGCTGINSGSTPASASYVIGSVNYVCAGRSGSTQMISLNGSAALSSATGSYAAGSASTLLGRYTSTGFPYPGKVLAMRVQHEAPSAAKCQADMRRFFGMTADTGQTWTIARATTEAVTVKGASNTVPAAVSAINESGLQLGAVGDAAQVDPTGILTWSGMDLELDWKVPAASSAITDDRVLLSTSAAKVIFHGASKTFEWLAGGASALSAAQTFASGDVIQVKPTYKAGAYARLKIGSGATVTASRAPSTIDLQPGEMMYLGGDATTVAGGSLSLVQVSRHADAVDTSSIPTAGGLPSHVFTANSVDLQGNATVAAGTFLKTWKTLVPTTLTGHPCGYCQDAVINNPNVAILPVNPDYPDGGNADAPVLRWGLTSRAYAVTFDGVFDDLFVAQSVIDVPVSGTGQFDLIVVERRASSNNASAYSANVANDTERGVSSEIPNAGAGTANTFVWADDQDGGQHVTITSDTGTVVTYRGAEVPFAQWAWREISGDSSSLYASNAPSTQIATPFAHAPSGSPIGDIKLGLHDYAYDGDLGAVLWYPRRLSAGERTQLAAWVNARWPLGTGNTGRVACVGDSITTNYRDDTHIPWCKQAELLDARKRQWANFGMAGQETPLIIPRYLGDSHGGTDYDAVVVLVGVNDVKNGSTSLATTESNLATLYATEIAAGKKVVAATILPFKNFAGWSTSIQANADALNTWIRAYVAAHPANMVLWDAYARYGDAVSEPFGQSGGDARALSAICDKGDGLHPHEPCISDMAAQALAAVNSLP
jgi:lysophospholipase L1-like esterase